MSELQHHGQGEKLTEMGILYKAPSGYVMQSPLLSVVNQCVDAITRLAREFGLTPASRSRLSARDESAVGPPGASLVRITMCG